MPPALTEARYQTLQLIPSPLLGNLGVGARMCNCGCYSRATIGHLQRFPST